MRDVKLEPTAVEATPGTAGLQTQVPGQPVTVSAAAEATGELAAGKFIQSDIDEDLFRFNSDDTPLMNLMLKAKKVQVDSPEVEHYMIDEPRYSVTTVEDVAEATTLQTVLPLSSKDQKLPRPYATLLVKGVDGYMPDGKTVTPGKDLMLFVTGFSNDTGNPIVIACNGLKDEENDEYSRVPAIPSGTQLILLSNALYETQKVVDPDLIVPRPTKIFLQKKGMNQIVSDYFEAQRKAIPFSKAIIAEQAITNFKVKGNRSLWASRASKFKVDTKLGAQYVYTTEGVRWQFKKELQHTGRWTVEKIIALAKMFFTGEDVPKTAYLLAGKNLLEQIQCIDYSKHPEIQISTKVNPVGWTVTNFHTVFGDIQVKREPTLDRLGWSNSGGLIGEGRLVHYVYRNESSFNEQVEDEEAKRSGLLVWDGLGLKGSCHIWIDGEGDTSSDSSTEYVMWESGEAPETTSGTKSPVYYLLQDCAGIGSNAKAGDMWQYDGSAWVEYAGEIYG